MSGCSRASAVAAYSACKVAAAAGSARPSGRISRSQSSKRYPPAPHRQPVSVPCASAASACERACASSCWMSMYSG